MGKYVRSAVGGMIDGAAMLFNLSSAGPQKKVTQQEYYRRVVEDMRDEICTLQSESAGLPED